MLVLELAAPGHAVTRRQFHLLVHFLHRFGDKAALVAPEQVGLHRDDAAARFAPDPRRALAHLDVGDGTERYGPAGRQRDRQIGDIIDGIAVRFGQAQRHIEAAVAFVEHIRPLPPNAVWMVAFTSLMLRP